MIVGFSKFIESYKPLRTDLSPFKLSLHCSY
jgi:hypothetical protein